MCWVIWAVEVQRVCPFQWNTDPGETIVHTARRWHKCAEGATAYTRSRVFGGF